jgi:predicted DCC family thiol-disulfide oxidoreductase YuxK
VADAARRRLPPSVEVVPWQWVTDLSAFGLTREDTARHAYWVDGDGRAHRGHLAVAAALEAMGGIWRVAGHAIRLPVIRTMAAGAYDLIAEHRHRLPGGTPACRLPRP